jgi:hypothetical protein
LIVQKRIPLKNNTLLSQFLSFIRKTLLAKPHDKRNESDRQMLLRVGRKFAVLFLVILMFDTLLDWFLGLTDLAIQLLQLIIQAIEYLFVIILWDLFQVNQQQSETILVNFTIIIALYLAYQLILAAPNLIIRVKQYLLSAWLQRIQRESSCWQAMSLIHKIKWLSAYSVGSTSLLLFI